MTDLYKEAARVLRKANLKEGSLKTLVYSSSYRNLRQLFALVSESVKFQTVLKDVLARCESSLNLMNEEMIDCDHELVLVLLYEMLIGNGFGHAGFVRKVMRKYQAEIKAAQSAILKEKNAVSLADLLKETSPESKAIPRYARVNLLKCVVKEAIEHMQEEGWEFVGKLNIQRFDEDVTSLEEYQFGLDPLLDDLLVFPVNTDLHDHALVHDGILVLQDKASCVPAYVLNPGGGHVVLDCCAAPGNKTSHLASLMRDQGRIIALDRDAKRMSTMKSLLERTGASSVETIVQDFLTLSPQSQDVCDIDMILVDPSCSGSGMHGSRLSLADRDANPQRLQSLKRFQISLLKHALRFPNVQRVVYSTCSVHQQENEEVVEEVMSNVDKYFQFVPVFPDWPDSRGLSWFPGHQNFLRLLPEKHLTAGFFVACFERKKCLKSICESENVDENGFQGRSEETAKENGKRKRKNVTAEVDGDLEIGRESKKKKEWDSMCSEDVSGVVIVKEEVIDDVRKDGECSSERKQRKSTEIKKEGNDSDENNIVEDLQNSKEKRKKKKKSKKKRDESESILELESMEEVDHQLSLLENVQRLSEKNGKNKKSKYKVENVEASGFMLENDEGKSLISVDVQCLLKKKKKKKKEEKEKEERERDEEEDGLSEFIPASEMIAATAAGLSQRKKRRKKKDKISSYGGDDQTDDDDGESEDRPPAACKKKKRKKCKE